MWSKRGFLAAALCVFAVQISGCSEDTEHQDCTGVGPARCLGGFVPDEITTSADGRMLSLGWDISDNGPICVKGGDYRSFLRLGPGDAKSVSVYLPNDGAWLPKSTALLLGGGTAPRSLDTAPQTNFTAANHPILGATDFLYVTACDGSLGVGDRDYSAQDLVGDAYRDKEPRFYRGYINSAASINELARQNPNPEKVFMIGSGAGSFGIILASMHAAEAFPNSMIYVLQDGSPGLAMGDVDPSFVADVISGWDSARQMPSDCPDCYANGHLTGFVDYALKNYPNMRYATYVSSNDTTIPLFVNLSRTTGQTKLNSVLMECFVQKEMERLRVAHADTNRFNYFVAKGSYNTVAALRSATDPENPDAPKMTGENFVAIPFDGGEGISFGDWFQQFVEDDAAWSSISEITMEASVENCKDLL